jgi:hypothetical protein
MRIIIILIIMTSTTSKCFAARNYNAIELGITTRSLKHFIFASTKFYINSSSTPPLLASTCGGVHCYLFGYALKTIRSGIAVPAAFIHSVVVIHSCRPAMTSRLDFPRTLTNALEDWLARTAKPDPSTL